jgi:23S rRNA (cytidine1920-2'-O)/16S rRNA (cytidine1409-2'-O)-methyltransferase
MQNRARPTPAGVEPCEPSAPPPPTLAPHHQPPQPRTGGPRGRANAGTRGKALRLDIVLVERALCPSREKAQRAILAGRVRCNGQLAHKASQPVGPADVVELDAPERYVSRGGLKLEHALRTFALDPKGCIALDVGASTGGFTDCLLQHGAARVFAVDVGRGLLAWALRRHPRVVVLEGTNARHLAPPSFPQPFVPFDLATVDCSFISLRLVLPPVLGLLRPQGRIVALIKPQFEAGKAEADRGRGVIADPAVHRRVLDELAAFVATLTALRWCATTESPILGPAGNREFLVLLEKDA